MKPQAWNTTLFTTLFILSLALVPFLATAFDIGFGDIGFQDAGIGDIPGDSGPGLGDIPVGGGPGLGDIPVGGGPGLGDIPVGGGPGLGDIPVGGGPGIGDIPVGGGPGLGDIPSGEVIPGVGTPDVFLNDLSPFNNIPGFPQGPDAFTPAINQVGQELGEEPDGEGGRDGEERDVLRIFINSIFLNDPFNQEPGNLVPLSITFENDGNRELENTKIIVVIPDLGIRDATGPIDLSVGKKITKTLLLELPYDVEPGTYPVRIQVYSGSGTSRIVHREIEIIDY